MKYLLPLLLFTACVEAHTPATMSLSGHQLLMHIQSAEYREKKDELIYELLRKTEEMNILINCLALTFPSADLMIRCSDIINSKKVEE